ncbi:MAG: hypothetical protein MJ168_03740 [Clostridia bacterium]|nr:hypothetical protein [Clostridia bacterium]
MKKRVISFSIALIMIVLNFSFTVNAAQEKEAFPHALAYSQAKDMKIDKRVQSIGVVEYETGRMIVDTKINDRFCPEAKTTILFAVYTALLTIQSDTITVASGAIIEPKNNILLIKEGMEVAVSDLVAAALYYDDLNSVAALALASDKSIGDFIVRINNLTNNLGMKNTVITNITGKYDEKQFTTVSDLLILSYMCYRNEMLINVTSSKSQFIKSSSLSENQNTLVNSFEFVDNESEYYNGNIYGIGISKDSKGITTSIVTYITSKQKYLFVIRSIGNTALNDVVDSLDFVKKNYALIDISKIIFELGEATTLKINGEKVSFSVIKNSVSNVNVVANLYYSKSVSSLNEAYSIEVPDIIPDTVKVGDVISDFKVLYNGNQISTVSLMVKNIGEEPEKEKTLGFTVYNESDVHIQKGSFLHDHSWIMIVIFVAAVGLIAIMIVNRINKI